MTELLYSVNKENINKPRILSIQTIIIIIIIIIIITITIHSLL